MKSLAKHSVYIWLGIFVFAVVLRLYRFNQPIADWHSWRQADTAAVARNFLKLGFDPLHPRYDDISNIQSGLDNPEGYRMVEFPLYQTVAAAGAAVTGIDTVELWLRGVAVFSSAATAVLVGLILSQLISIQVGTIAAFVYATLPYSVYYGRTILPDTITTFLAVASVYAAFRYSEIQKQTHRSSLMVWLAISVISGASALLVKPTGAFLLVPLAVLLFPRRRNTGAVVQVFIAGVCIIVPLFLWRRWITQFPEGIPASDWLFNEGNIRLKGAWFWWLFAKRIGELILGFWGLIPFGLGLVLVQKKKEALVLYSWALGILAYFVIIARGSVQHDYYQIIALPVIAAFTAIGFVHIWNHKHTIHPFVPKVFAILTFVFMTSFSWYTVRTYYWINKPEIVEAGQVADQMLPASAKVIASYNGDTSFLYQINRQGWPLGFDIDDKITKGATHYVTISTGPEDGETAALASEYTVLVRNDRFAIIDLTTPNSEK